MVTATPNGMVRPVAWACIGRACIVASALASGCSDGGGGEPSLLVKGQVLGAGRKIADLTDPSKPRVSPTELLQVSGVRVVAIDQYDETNGGAAGGIYLQDFTETPKAFEGVLAFKPAYTPPTFRASIGDVVDVSTLYSDFIPSFLQAKYPRRLLPELTGNTISLRFDAPYKPLVPVVLDNVADATLDAQPFDKEGAACSVGGRVQDLLLYDCGRRWLSMLVTLKGVALNPTANKDNAGRFAYFISIRDGVDQNDQATITNELFDLGGSGFKPEDGKRYDITGIVTLFQRFHVAPRTLADIVPSP